MQFDLVYQEIGDFGRLQKYIVYVGSICSTYGGLLFLNSVFTLAIPEYR